ncbi:MAG: beta-N-acetylhexosaminidase [Deltaproteobacteria bacterium]|jgi:beta-N-acetylhexosaminidase|nr:beta-N-acetylhexosaminidase [Deltaproteobacteria bacterium]
MNKKFGQLMIIGIQGKSLSEDEKKFIINNNISGIILMGRNCESPKQVHDLCTEIQSLRFHMPDKAPLFIGIDMEGGRVQRLKSPFTLWPPARKMGELDNASISFLFSQKMGMELKSVGINLNFAPCVDIFSNPQNTVIGDRALGTDPEQVGKHASALVRGYIKSEIIPCVKHFPGHGNTLIDSHEDLPTEDAELKRLEDFELIPFKRSFKARVEMCMTSHILFPKIDPKYPVTFSEIFIKKVLKEANRFRGLVITDDLDMKALTKNYSPDQIPILAMKAGCDLLLYCNEPLSPPRALEALIEATAQGVLDINHLEQVANKIIAFKKEKITNPDPMTYEEASKIVGCEEHQKIAEAVRLGVIPEGLLL